MMDYKRGFFSRMNGPRQYSEIAKLEAEIGLELPSEYRELLHQTGGGRLGESMRSFLTFGPKGGERSVMIGSIFGIDEGVPNLIESPELMGPEGWGAPAELLIFANSISGPAESVGINYGLEQYPYWSIIYVDIERGNEMVKLADSFEEFMGSLVPYEG